jgi:O-antigen/teichoic acid export membrane protein
MKSLKSVWQNWIHDLTIVKVIRNSGYLLFSNVFSVIQSVLTGRLLGIMGFGVIGTITTFASTLNRLFSFRMNELVVKYYGEAMETNQKERAAAIVKASLFAESVTALLSFGFCVIFAPYAARTMADDPSLAPQFILYGTIILANLVMETTTGVLQVNGQFRIQAVINLISNLFTAAIIVWAYIIHGGLLEIVIAYMAGKFVLGIGTSLIGFKELRKTLGPGWFKTPLSHLPPIKELTQFAFSTNISSTIIMLVRDNEVLWIAYFLTPLEAGYAKAALAIINFVQLPITPFISTTYPEINRAVTQKAWGHVKGLLKKVTAISGVWTIGASIGLAIFGRWLLGIYGADFVPAYQAMMIFLVGLGFANIFFWNRPLLLSLGMPMVPYRFSLYSGLMKVLLTVLLVPALGLNMEAGLLSAFFLVSVGGIVIRGLKEIHHREKQDGPEEVSA